MENNKKIKEIMDDLKYAVYNNCQTVGDEWTDISEAFQEATLQLIELLGKIEKNEKEIESLKKKIEWLEKTLDQYSNN